MTRLSCVALVAVLLGLSVETPAVTLSGVLIYSTDDFGNPTGYDWDKEQLLGGELWRTAKHFHWYSLGLASGLPPESFHGKPLNAPDSSIAIPLSEGPNDFTLLGLYGTGTEWDTRYALNLFFDGVLDSPGISVLFPREDMWDTSPPIPNLSNIMVSLDVGTAPGIASASYDDGMVTVSVVDVHFFPSSAFPGVDMVSDHAPQPDGGQDRVGILRIQVDLDASDTGAPKLGGGFRGPPGPVDFGMQAYVGPDKSGGLAPVRHAIDEKQTDGAGASRTVDFAGTAEPSAGPAGTPTAAGTLTVAGTPTAAGTLTVAGTPTAAGTPSAAGTPTAAGTPSAAGTPTAGGTLTAARGTQTPSGGSHGTPTPHATTGSSVTPNAPSVSATAATGSATAPAPLSAASVARSPSRSQNESSLDPLAPID